MNTGQALVMSPSLLTKYLDAGKKIAGHAVLLPDGLRFSAKKSRRDWTEEIVGEIRELYRQFTDARGSEKVNLQGIVFETNEGGRLPVEQYLAATLAERSPSAQTGRISLETLARERGLNAKYLGNLAAMLNGKEPSLLLDGLRARWHEAKSDGAAALAADVARWQKALWKFNSVGHIGKLNGPTSWMEPVNPLVSKQDVRMKLPSAPDNNDMTLYLVASDAGDGNENDFVIWERPRLVAPGGTDLLLRDVREISGELTLQRAKMFTNTARLLRAATEAGRTRGRIDVAALAAKYGVGVEGLGAWFDYLGIGTGIELRIDSYFTNQLTNLSNYDFINGWGSTDTPSIVANSSDQAVRIPGNMKPHSVAVHPSPKLAAAVGWRCPAAATMRITASVTHAHPECGNGVTWSLELRRGATRQRMATGVAQGNQEVKIGPFEKIAIQQGDLISLLIGPRDGNHSCDLTAIDLVLTSQGDPPQTWSLAAEVSPDVLAGNPHADGFGNLGVWHFYTEPDNGSGTGPVIPAGSLLAKWQAAPSSEAKEKLAEDMQTLLIAGPTSQSGPDKELYQQLASLRGPLFTRAIAGAKKSPSAPVRGASDQAWGLEQSVFGRHPNGEPRDEASLCVRAPSVIEIRLPADLAAGCEFVASGRLDPTTGAEGSVQLQVLTNKPGLQLGLLPGTVTETQADGAWTSSHRGVSHDTPIVVNEGSAARKHLEAAFEDFRRWFPAALCYAKIVPVDEVITLTLFHREDEPLMRLMLDDAQKARLDRLWDQLRYVSQDSLTRVDAFEQLWQYATQDADPKVFEPLRKPIQDSATAFRKRLLDTEPAHMQAVLDFANRAYRRPLTGAELDELRRLYKHLREQELPHDQAIRLTLARVLVAPAFLYRAETPGPGKSQSPLNDSELANRLSYFLWSSMPDSELASLAAAAKLHRPEVLSNQTRRMLRDARVRRLATEFACQWLHVHDFDALNEKSERHFPTFDALRGPMYEESIRFFTDFFQANRSILSILNADYSFLNETLARHYGIPGVTGEEWRRVEGMQKYSRGGILGQGAVLAKQSGASRTSPILRGNWVAEALLGDKLPRPPKDVPRLPEDEATENLTMRQLTEKHTTDPRCAGCHSRIDAFGFALESFDAIGRHRDRDLGNRPIDDTSRVADGTALKGFEGLRDYLLTQRRNDFLKQFCRKLLGYSLGRGVQLSDEPLLKEMRDKLAANDYRIDIAIQSIVSSRQFREIRGKEMAHED
jgi:hypothetical protein